MDPKVAEWDIYRFAGTEEFAGLIWG